MYPRISLTSQSSRFSFPCFVFWDHWNVSSCLAHWGTFKIQTIILLLLWRMRKDSYGEICSCPVLWSLRNRLGLGGEKHTPGSLASGRTDCFHTGFLRPCCLYAFFKAFPGPVRNDWLAWKPCYICPKLENTAQKILLSCWWTRSQLETKFCVENSTFLHRYLYKIWPQS